jgi:hypothetical protein
MRKKKKNHQSKISNHHWARPLSYKVDPTDSLVLILRDGTRIKQKEGLDVFLSQDKCAYSLTRYGLRRIRINYTRKRRYGKKSRNGVNNGRRYPYVMYGCKKYDVHLLVVLAWIGVRKDGEEIDHINGDIDDCRTINLRIVSREENRRCAQILRRLRKAAQELHDPSLNPRNMSQERLLKIYATITVDDPKDIMERDMTQHREW